MEELEEEDSGEEDEEEMEGEDWDEDEEGGAREFVEDDSDLEEGMSDLEDWSGEDGEEVSRVSSLDLSLRVSLLTLSSFSSDPSHHSTAPTSLRRMAQRTTTSQWPSHQHRIPKESVRRSPLLRRRRRRLLLRRRRRRVGRDLGWRLSTSRRWRPSP